MHQSTYILLLSVLNLLTEHTLTLIILNVLAHLSLFKQYLSLQEWQGAWFVTQEWVI